MLKSDWTYCTELNDEIWKLLGGRIEGARLKRKSDLKHLILQATLKIIAETNCSVTRMSKRAQQKHRHTWPRTACCVKCKAISFLPSDLFSGWKFQLRNFREKQGPSLQGLTADCIGLATSSCSWSPATSSCCWSPLQLAAAAGCPLQLQLSPATSSCSWLPSAVGICC